MEDALLRVGLAPIAPVMSAAPRSPQRMAPKDARAGGLHATRHGCLKRRHDCCASSALFRRASRL